MEMPGCDIVELEFYQLCEIGPTEQSSASHVLGGKQELTSYLSSFASSKLYWEMLGMCKGRNSQTCSLAMMHWHGRPNGACRIHTSQPCNFSSSLFIMAWTGCQCFNNHDETTWM